MDCVGTVSDPSGPDGVVADFAAARPYDAKSIALLQRLLRQFDLDLFPIFVLNVEIGFNEREFDWAIHSESRPFVTLVLESEIGLVGVLRRVYDVVNDRILAAHNHPIHASHTRVPTFFRTNQSPSLPSIRWDLTGKRGRDKQEQQYGKWQ